MENICFIDNANKHLLARPTMVSFCFPLQLPTRHNKSTSCSNFIAMSSHRPLRIACLHGYLQNAELFRLKTGGLRKHLERSKRAVRASVSSGASRSSDADNGILVEFIYLEAPFVLEERASTGSGQPKTESEKYKTVYSPVRFSKSGSSKAKSSSNDAIDRTKRSWWEAEQDGQVYKGWERSIEYLSKVFKEMHFDGVLGFSQGSVAASLLCVLRKENSERGRAFSSLRFGIFVSGFVSRARAHKTFFSKQIDLPSLHIWGSTDRMVAPEWSQKLMEKFTPTGRANVIHSKGHMVPTDATSRRLISRFLLDASDNINRNSGAGSSRKDDNGKNRDNKFTRSAL